MTRPESHYHKTTFSEFTKLTVCLGLVCGVQILCKPPPSSYHSYLFPLSPQRSSFAEILTRGISGLTCACENIFFVVGGASGSEREMRRYMTVKHIRNGSKNLSAAGFRCSVTACQCQKPHFFSPLLVGSSANQQRIIHTVSSIIKK